MILVVDDDKILCALLKSLLENAGYDVEVAYNGEEAYPKLKKPSCRLVFLDIRMPGINGAELLMLMTAEGIRVPVVVIAGFPDFDEEEIKQFPNVRKMFHKPLYPEDILSAAREYTLKFGNLTGNEAKQAKREPETFHDVIGKANRETGLQARREREQSAKPEEQLEKPIEKGECQRSLPLRYEAVKLATRTHEICCSRRTALVLAVAFVVWSLILLML